ncbi:MAG TPA: SCP2 sterol-binding domain-containing protein [Solirubrobacteraceae bacterium]|nr:SCP2 sterol-binding domain-containing protein [Solirubrobacteraceae bacterium]
MTHAAPHSGQRRRRTDAGVRPWLGEQLIELDRIGAVHAVLMRVMSRAIALRFNPAAADGLEATLELALHDPHGRPPTHYRLMISDGRCAVRPGRAADAGATASIGSDDLIRLASGAVGWPELFSSGRFELNGDPFLALRFAGLFRLPVVLDPV